MVVLQAAANTEVKRSATSEKSALRRAIQSCEVTDSSTRLNEALKMAESLTRDNNDAEVHLFSDGAAPGMKELENKGLRLVYHRVGQSANNLGIVTLDVRPNPEIRASAPFSPVWPTIRQKRRRPSWSCCFDGQLLETKTAHDRADEYHTRSIRCRAAARRRIHGPNCRQRRHAGRQPGVHHKPAATTGENIVGDAAAIDSWKRHSRLSAKSNSASRMT